jgi:hypothetical protein
MMDRFRELPMFKKILIVVLAVVLTACAGTPSPAPTPAPGQLDLEQQAVYAAILHKLYSSTNFVIMDTTATSPVGVGDTASVLGNILQNMHGVDPLTVNNFRARNDASYPVSPRMDLGVPYVLLTSNQMMQLFNQNRDGWQLFYEQYPDAPGITTLSRAGFNAAFDQALVYIGTLSQWQAGAGYFVLLDKMNGAWLVDQQVMSWIS